MTIEYDPASKKYVLDARTTTKTKALSALRAGGLTCRKADMLLHLCKLAATVNLYFDALEREPVPEPITYEEFRSIVLQHARQRPGPATQPAKSGQMGPRVYPSGQDPPQRLWPEARP